MTSWHEMNCVKWTDSRYQSKLRIQFIKTNWCQPVRHWWVSIYLLTILGSSISWIYSVDINLTLLYNGSHNVYISNVIHRPAYHHANYKIIFHEKIQTFKLLTRLMTIYANILVLRDNNGNVYLRSYIISFGIPTHDCSCKNNKKMSGGYIQGCLHNICPFITKLKCFFFIP